MIMNRTRTLLLAGAIAMAGSATADEQTLSVLMPWQGEGSVHKVGEEKVLFSGEFEGIMYAETASGELDTAFAECPARQEINLTTKKTSATGHCNITVSPEEVVYADWECTGELGVCKGKFTLTGGTGKFKGVTGSSDLVIRSVLSAVVVGMGDGSVVRASSGLAVLPELKYTLAASK